MYLGHAAYGESVKVGKDKSTGRNIVLSSNMMAFHSILRTSKVIHSLINMRRGGGGIMTIHSILNVGLAR